MIRYCPFIFAFLMSFILFLEPLQIKSAFAETDETITEETKDTQEPVQKHSHGVTRIPPGLGAHKPTYFLVSWSSFDEDRLNEEVKYQISFKQRMLPWGNLPDENDKYRLFFALTLKSFWQVFDRSKSSPFRETNYNPEIFLRTPEFNSQWGTWRVDCGVEHESNGQNIPASRSWDRMFIRPGFERGIFSITCKLWHRFEESEKTDELDTRGDDNPDIEDFYGYGELDFRIDFSNLKNQNNAVSEKLIYFDESCINVMARYNASESNGAVQIDYWIPLINRMKIYFQYWNGYGESLIDYNNCIIKYSAGLALTN